jgi:hypothetical protein
MKFLLPALLVISFVVAQATSQEAASQEAAPPKAAPPIVAAPVAPAPTAPAPIAAASPKAASPEDSYYASRDAYIAKFATTNAGGNIGDDTLRQHALALDQLAKLLRPIIGTVTIKGFPAKAKSNLVSLFKSDVDFGRLDGLLYSSPDDKTQVTVTTEALVQHWLREHKEWWVAANVPQDVNDALKSEAFYTQALATDAAVFKYTELPVVKPIRDRFAFAMLVARAQTLGPRKPDELIVAMMQGARVFLVSAPANPNIIPMPPCQKIWQQSERKAVAADTARVASERKDDPHADQRDQIEEQGDAAYRECFAQQARRQGFFFLLVRQAQALVDRLP